MLKFIVGRLLDDYDARRIYTYCEVMCINMVQIKIKTRGKVHHIPV